MKVKEASPPAVGLLVTVTDSSSNIGKALNAGPTIVSSSARDRGSAKTNNRTFGPENAHL